MSYNLSISGHHGDPAVAEQIDRFVEAKGREIVAAVQELDRSAVANATFSGPTGSVNLLEAEPAAEPTEAVEVDELPAPDDVPTTGAPDTSQPG